MTDVNNNSKIARQERKEELLHLLDRPITLIGMMGAGKTRLGIELGKILSVPFVDSDKEIEAAARLNVSDIFAALGEQAFRDGEKRVIKRLIEEAEKPFPVIATGGGCVVTPETVKRLHKKSYCIWLDASMDVLVERTTRHDRRPLLRTGDPKKILKKLFDDRHESYDAASHIRLAVGDYSAAKTAHIIIERLIKHINEHKGA
jgi:shikimate kinase